MYPEMTEEEKAFAREYELEQMMDGQLDQAEEQRLKDQRSRPN